MPHCQNDECGEHVTSDYIRCFAPDDADEIDRCPNCAPWREIHENGAVRDDPPKQSASR